MLGIFAEIFSHPLFEIFGQADILVRPCLDHVLDGLPYPLAAGKEAEGFIKPILRRDDLRGSMLCELALGKINEGVARHRIKFNAFAAEKELDLVIGRAVASQSIAYFGTADIAKRDAFRFETKFLDVG
jgi:hypothetical protein